MSITIGPDEERLLSVVQSTHDALCKGKAYSRNEREAYHAALAELGRRGFRVEFTARAGLIPRLLTSDTVPPPVSS